MNFSVCVDAVFNGKDFYESIETLANAGVKNVEFWSWWEHDMDRLLELKNKYDLNIVGFCTRFESMLLPEKKEAYLSGLKETCEVAKKLGTKNIITKPLDKIPGMSHDEMYQNMVELLKEADPILKEYDMTLLLEPVNNRYEAPETFLPDVELGFKMIEEIGSKNIALLFDFYHIQIDEGDVLKRLLPNIHMVKHIHTAGSTNRHELYDGELNYDYIFKMIDETGYDGCVGLEYFPKYENPLSGVLSVINK